MSSDPSQSKLTPRMLRSIELRLNQQILSARGTTNQTIQSNQGVLSSDGPNASQTTQVANSNINQVTNNYHIKYLNLGASVSANGDHGAYPNGQVSQSTNIASQFNSKTSQSIGSSSVQNVRSSDLRARQADFNARLAAVKESTVELGKSTAKLKGSTFELAEITAKLDNSVTSLNWPTIELAVGSEPTAKFGDSTVQLCMSTISFSRSAIGFGRATVNFGLATVQSSDSMAAFGESISLVVANASSLELGKLTARHKEDSTLFMKALTAFSEPTIKLNEFSGLLEKLAPQLRESIGPVVELVAIEETAVELGKSVNNFSKWLTAFGESLIAFSKSITALDDLLTAFNPQNQ